MWESEGERERRTERLCIDVGLDAAGFITVRGARQGVGASGNPAKKDLTIRYLPP